jgi:hypothetical protein
MTPRHSARHESPPEPHHQPPRVPQHVPRHRAGRSRGQPVSELLAQHTQQPATPTGRNALNNAWTASRRHAAHPEDHGPGLDTPTAATALGLNLTELNDLDVFAAASIVRRRAHTATTRLYRCRPRLRRARRTTGIALDSTALTSSVTERVLAVQIAETRLVTALDKLETITGRARAARDARRLFYPYGGRLIISGPMHERLAHRQDLADNTADAIHTIARRNLRLLLGETAVAERFAAGLERYIDHALDHAAAAAAAAAGDAPPPILALLRAALPTGQRHEWWREICALFAEATPTERGHARLSLLLNAHRTLWTTWTIWAHARRHPTRSDSAAPDPSTSDAAPGSDTHHPDP